MIAGSRFSLSCMIHRGRACKNKLQVQGHCTQYASQQKFRAVRSETPPQATSAHERICPGHFLQVHGIQENCGSQDLQWARGGGRGREALSKPLRPILPLNSTHTVRDEYENTIERHCVWVYDRRGSRVTTLNVPHDFAIGGSSTSTSTVIGADSHYEVIAGARDW